MAINVAQFEFTCNTSPGVQTIATGLGFTPKAYIIWTTGATANATYGTHYYFCIGFTDGTTSRCIGAASEDGQASSDTGRMYGASVMRIPLVTAPDVSPDAIAVHSSFGSGTIVINWSDAPASAFKCYGIAFGGADLQAEVRAYTYATTSAGNANYTGCAFQPEVAFFLTPEDNGTLPVQKAHSAIGFGAAVSTTKRFNLSVNSEDNQTTMDTWSFGSNARCIGALGDASGSVTSRAQGDFAAWLSNGVTINWIVAPHDATNHFFALYMAGGDWDIGMVAKRTSTGDTTISPSVNTMKGLILGSVMAGNSTSALNHNRISLGAASSTTAQGGCWAGDKDASANAENANRSEDSNILIMATENATAGSSVTEALASITAMSTTATLNYTTATAVTGDIFWLAVGEVTTQNFNGNITESALSVGTGTSTRILGALRPITESGLSVGTGTSTRILGALRPISESTISINQTLSRLLAASRSILEAGPILVKRNLASTDVGGSQLTKATGSDTSVTINFIAFDFFGVEWYSERGEFSKLDWDNGTWNVNIRVTNPNSNINLHTIQLSRVANNDIAFKSGKTTYIGVTLSSAGDYNYNINWNDGTQNPGNRAADDRVFLGIYFENTSASLQSIDIGTNLSNGNDEVITTINNNPILTTDSVTRLREVPRSITEDAITIDQTLARLLAATRPINESSITSGETLTRLLAALRSINESSLTSGETLARILGANRLITESSISIDEALTRLLAATRPINETSISINQTLTRILGALRSITEGSLTSGETLTRLLAATRPINEPSISIGETLTRVLGATRTINESSISVGETLTRILGALRSITESSITINDSVTGFAGRFKTITEDAITIDDSVTRIQNIIKTINESAVTIGETLTRILAATRPITESSVSVGETLTRILGALRTITEGSITVDETLTRILGALRSISEAAITIDDDVTGDHQLGTITITEDAITINDNVTRIQNIMKTITESTITIDDTLVRILGALRTINEPSISTNDSVTRLLAALRNSIENVTINDTVTRIQNIIKTITESTVTIDETLARIFGALRTINESSISTNDSITRLFETLRNPTDNVTINDTVIRILNSIRTINESTVTINDTLVRIFGALRTINESSISTNDSVTRLLAALRNPTDDVTINDTVTRIQNIIKILTESNVTIDETLARIFGTSKTLSEPLISTNDSITRLLAAIRNPIDTTEIQDTITRLQSIIKTINEGTVNNNDSVQGTKVILRFILEARIKWYYSLLTYKVAA